MLPLIRREIVEKHGLLSEEIFLETVALAQSLPGAVAINTASLIGLALGGVQMQCLAVLATVLPSFGSIVAAATLFLRFREFYLVQAFFRGALAVVASLVALAVWQIGKKTAENARDILIAMCFFLLLFYTRIHPLFVILFGGGLGVLLQR